MSQHKVIFFEKMRKGSTINADRQRRGLAKHDCVRETMCSSYMAK